MDPEKHDKVAYAGIVDVLLASRANAPVHTANDEKNGAELQQRFPGLAKINHA